MAVNIYIYKKKLFNYNQILVDYRLEVESSICSETEEEWSVLILTLCLTIASLSFLNCKNVCKSLFRLRGMQEVCAAMAKREQTLAREQEKESTWPSEPRYKWKYGKTLTFKLLQSDLFSSKFTLRNKISGCSSAVLHS